MSGETAVITGAGRGIGKAVATTFAADGIHVVVSARTKSAIDAVADDITDAGNEATAIRADVRDEYDVERLMEQAARISGDLDYIVANAGVYHGETGETPLTTASYSAYDDHLRTNGRGVFATIRESLPHLASDARILVSSGRVARTEPAGYGSYAVSKATAEAIARGFSADIEQPVSIVDPGLVETSLTEKSGLDPADVAAQFLWVATEAPADEIDGSVIDRKQWRKASR